MRQQLHRFISDIVPGQGFVSLVSPQDSGMRHTIYDNKETLSRYLNFATLETDTYFSLSTYKQKWHKVTMPSGREISAFRTQENVHLTKSIWLDIDVGEDKGYPSTYDALKALVEFTKQTGLPTPWVVNSGSGGLHVYWAFNQEIDGMRWRKLANRFFKATEMLELKADPSRTRDGASILRLPLTSNGKFDPPRPVEILMEGKRMDVEVAEELLDKYRDYTDLVVPPIPPAMQAVLQSVAHRVPNFTLVEKEYTMRPATEVSAACPQMTDQEGAEEPVWRGMLAVMRHCEGGREHAHELSKLDPRYSYDDTERKLHYLEDREIAPYTCSVFRSHRPEVCAKCPNNGLINSPISAKVSKIPVAQVEAPVEANTATEQVDTTVPLGSPSHSDVPEFENEKIRINSLGCFVRKSNRESGQSWWSRVYDFPVYPIQRLKTKLDTGEINISYIFRKHDHRGVTDFQIQGSVLLGNGLISYLGSIGFLIADKDKKDMAGLLVEILKSKQEDLEETNATDQLGWDREQTCFLVNDKLYKTSGDVVSVVPRGKAAQTSADTVAKGSLDRWKRIADVYNRPGLEWGQAIVASAFASPLMPLGALEKAAMLFVTGEKGAGKSTALMLAVSVYGNPHRLMINKDDTALARIEKLGMLNNISACFDEMTDLLPAEASRLAYQITQGRGKDRMGDGGKGLQRNTTYWSCLPVMSANDSIINALSQHSADATAQMSRVLEIKASDIGRVYSPSEFDTCEALVRDLPNHYGTAGDKYIRYVTSNLDYIKEVIAKTERIFLQRTKLTSTYRFWTYMCTRMLVGMMIAKELGIVNYDIPAFMDYLVDIVTKAKISVSSYESNPDTLLPEFLNSHISNRLDVKAARRPKEMQDNPEMGVVNDMNYVIRHPAHGRELIMRAEADTHTGFISTTALRQWCAERRVVYDDMIRAIEKQGLMLNAKAYVTLGKGTFYRDTGRTRCIKIKLPMEVQDPQTGETT